MNRTTKWALASTVAVAIAGAALYAGTGWARYGGTINAAHVDLSQPDGLVVTPALSRLPRDLVRANFARELLTEDFAFYYEDHEDRLGVAGALKRIAFEHDTTFGDDLLALALDQPAEVALWADVKGAPRHWLLAMTRGPLAKALQQAGALAAKDRQLTVLGTLPGAGHDTVYALTLSARRTLALVSRGDRVVVLSDPGLLYTDQRQLDPHAAERVAQLLSSDRAAQGAYRQAFGLGDPGADHVIVADSRLLSFHYGHFFPGMKALQLDVAPGGGTLRTRLRVAGAQSLPTADAATALWAGLPAGAAACSWLPVDWHRAQAVLEKAPQPAVPGSAPAKGAQARSMSKDAAGGQGAPSAWARFTAALDGPAAVCWYARSQFHTPLVVARTRDTGPATDAALAGLAGWLMPGPSPLRASTPEGARRWQREVAAPYGPDGAGDKSLYHPTLARQGAWIAFSPDDVLVDLALATQGRRYPSLATTLPAGDATLAMLAPAQVADLTQREAFEVLPAQQELFRQAAKAHLVPRLDTMRRWPAVRVAATGPVDAAGWVSLDWQPVGGAR